MSQIVTDRVVSLFRLPTSLPSPTSLFNPTNLTNQTSLTITSQTTSLVCVEVYLEGLGELISVCVAKAQDLPSAKIAERFCISPTLATLTKQNA